MAVGVGGSGSDWVVVELLEAILSFLKRGILADVYTESVKKNICYLFGVETGEKDRRIFLRFDTRSALKIIEGVECDCSLNKFIFIRVG